MSERFDVVVIGAGISGLAMAYRLQQAGKSVVVLEKEGRAGGCFHSEVVPGEGAPFWLEMGTHTCFNSYGRLLRLLADLTMIDQLRGRKKLRYKLLADGGLCSIPSRLRFGELATHAWRLFSLKKGGKSVSEYYSALVGPVNYRNLFRHAFNAVVCQPADDVPADMLFRKRARDKNVMRSYTFPTGLSDIITAMEAKLVVRKDVSITAIHAEAPGYRIEAGEASWTCSQLVCATPAPAAARLLAGVEAELAEQLQWIDEVEVESVGIVVEASDLSLEPVAGVIAVDGDFYSAVSRDFVSHAKRRGFTFHFKPGLLDDETKLDRICALLQIERSALLYVFHKTNRLPAPGAGHHALIEGIDSMLADKPVALVGNYFDGVAVEDCLERVDCELARLIRQ